MAECKTLDSMVMRYSLSFSLLRSIVGRRIYTYQEEEEVHAMG
jgi:hypothetical protein